MDKAIQSGGKKRQSGRAVEENKKERAIERLEAA